MGPPTLEVADTRVALSRPLSQGAQAAVPLASAYLPPERTGAPTPLLVRNLEALLAKAGRLDPERDAPRLRTLLRAIDKQLGLMGHPGASELHPSRPPVAPKFTGDLQDPPGTLAGLKFLAHVLTHSPSAPEKVLGLLQLHPHPAQVLAHAAKLYPGITPEDRPRVAQALKDDLQIGGLGRAIEDQLGQLGLSARETEQFFAVFAEVREGFRIGAELGDDLQRVNWLHTRVEVLHTLEIAQSLGLSKKEAKAALYGSLFSDAFKDQSRYSLLWHNRPGAELIAPAVLGRHLDLNDPEAQALLAWTMRVAHEHQVTPPLFMAGPMRAALLEVVQALPEEKRAERMAAVEGIVQKITTPMAAPQHDGELQFSALEKQLLAQVGLPGWAVPHEAPWRLSSIAAIVGDVAQYVSWEGIIKIAVDLRDPGSPMPFMRDPVLCVTWLHDVAPDAAQTLAGRGQSGAIESSMEFSFSQGMSVVKEPKALAAMDEAKASAQGQLRQDVLPEIERRLREMLGVDPGAKTPPIPYWNQPIAEPGALSEAERGMVDRVKRVAAEVMAEIGGVPLDPFKLDGGKS
ncbi:MAG: hypothetical protein IPG45_12080 [Deltaproteobacteria bacterium]|nr:hypothetical protein [Deltaproteobacteria bacterium]